MIAKVWAHVMKAWGGYHVHQHVPECRRQEQQLRLKISWTDVLRSKKRLWKQNHKGNTATALVADQSVTIKVSPFEHWRSDLWGTMLSSVNNHLAKYSNMPKPIIQQGHQVSRTWYQISILQALESLLKYVVTWNMEWNVNLDPCHLSVLIKMRSEKLLLTADTSREKLHTYKVFFLKL